MRIRQVEMAFGIACGSFATYKWMPLQRELQASNAIMRKRWMRYPIACGIFGAAYYFSQQIPVRFLQKATHRNEGISHETYQGKTDLVSRFRLFEN